MSGDGLQIHVQNASGARNVPSPQRIREWVAAALRDVQRGELTVRIVREAESADLNLRYRGLSGPTNVLSFPAEAGVPVSDGEAPPLGDLVICAARLREEARHQGKPLEAHWAHIVIHGTLHLIGYDHDTAEEAQAMEGRERDLLAGFGYPDPYAELPCK